MTILLDLLYPPHCLHCKEKMVKHARFCHHCLSHFSLLPPEGHCDKCFASIPILKGTCKPCREKQHIMCKLGSCFDAYGPAQTLLKTFLKTRQPHFAKEVASFIVVQLDRLAFPPFDLITMVPMPFSNPQYAIAKEVSRLFSIPFLPTLSRKIHPEVHFALKRNCNLVDKRLLLLETFINTCQTIRRAAHALSLGWPQTLYGMSFCAT